MSTSTAEQRPVELDGWAFKWMVWLMLVPAVLVAAGFTLLLPVPWSVVVASAGGVLVLSGALRARRVSVAIGPDSVRVVNLLRTHEIGWPEIAGIELSSGSVLEEGVSRGVRLELRDGRRILCQAATGYGPWATSVLEAFRLHAARWGTPIVGGPA